MRSYRYDSQGRKIGIWTTTQSTLNIRNVEIIKRLQPDFDLMKLSDALDLIGFYIFSFDGVENGRDAGARMFAPRYGIQEESATGMAVGPLASYLREYLGIDKQEFSLEQRWMSPPSGRGALKEIAKVAF